MRSYTPLLTYSANSTRITIADELLAIVPGGLNLYYLDVAPKTEGVMHRTTSTDYLVVLQGTPSLLTPPSSFDVVDGQGTYDKPVETVCKPGDIVLQRGIMHAYVFQGGGTSLPSDLDVRIELPS